MWHKSLIGALPLLALTGCADLPFAVGYEGHMVDLEIVTTDGKVIHPRPPSFVYYQTKDPQTKVWVAVDRADTVMEACHKVANAEAAGCTYKREDHAPLWSFPFKINCVMITPPSQLVFDHEIRHCLEGDWH